jgi:hypothetical protein
VTAATLHVVTTLNNTFKPYYLHNKEVGWENFHSRLNNNAGVLVRFSQHVLGRYDKSQVTGNVWPQLEQLYGKS